MRTINLHDAKTHLSRLVDQAAAGEAFIIAKAGRPLVQVIPLDAPPKPTSRLGFLPDSSVPEDFDQLAAAEIQALFEGS
jgi:prevent-host-death family protein